MSSVNPVVDSKQHSHVGVAGLRIEPMRTLRVAYDRTSDLPAGLGRFPIYSVADFRSGVPSEWQDGFFFMPMYQSEALWLNFDRGSVHGEPYALIVAAGAINAISGRKMTEARLAGDPQNYVAIPPQRWIDGWKNEDGTVCQFVAAPLGSGETMEGQITGEEKTGGIQLAVFKPKPGQNVILEPFPYEHIVAGSPLALYELATLGGGTRDSGTKSFGMPVSMGLGRGGRIRQKIHGDPYGLAVWNELSSGSSCVYLVNSEVFRQITDRDPPHRPFTRQDYNTHGIPWFELYEEHAVDVAGSPAFAGTKPVTEPAGEKPGSKPDVFQALGTTGGQGK